MKKMTVAVTLLLVLSFVVSACGGEATPAPTPAPTVTPAPTATQASTLSPTPVVTKGPSPAAATPVPTVTSTATPAPSPGQTATPAPSPTPTPKPIALKVVCVAPQTDLRGPQLNKFKELVEKYTDGRVTVQLFMGGVLFPAAAEWEAVSTGAADVSFSAPFYAEKVIPQFHVWYLFDGTWEGAQHGWAVLQDGRVNKTLHDMAWDKGIKQLAVVPYVTISSVVSRNKEIKSFADMNGLKAGVRGEPIAMWSEHAKIKATVIGTGEEYLALSQGIIDLFMTSITGVVSAKMYEVAKYLYVLPGGYSPTMLWMNKARWNSLPADIQDIMLKKVAPELEQFGNEQASKNESQTVETLKTKMTVNFATTEQMAAAREFLKTNAKAQAERDRVGPQILNIVDELRPKK